MAARTHDRCDAAQPLYLSAARRNKEAGDNERSIFEDVSASDKGRDAARGGWARVSAMTTHREQ